MVVASEKQQHPRAAVEPVARVLIVEDHSLLADLLGHILDHHGFEVRVAASAEHGTELVQTWSPDSVLIDLSEPGLVERLVEDVTHAGVDALVLTADVTAPELADYLDAGAAGFFALDGSIDDLTATVTALAEGRQVLSLEQRYRVEDARRERDRRDSKLQPFEWLTKRESEILSHLSRGMSAAEIADHNCVALSTVRTQIRSILSKLNVRSQLAAVALAREAGWNE